MTLDFPGSGWVFPCQCRGHGLDLAREDSRSCGTAEPMRPRLRLGSTVRESPLLSPGALGPSLRDRRSPCNEKPTAAKYLLQLKKACVQQRRPSAIINEINNFLKRMMVTVYLLLIFLTQWFQRRVIPPSFSPGTFNNIWRQFWLVHNSAGEGTDIWNP